MPPYPWSAPQISFGRFNSKTGKQRWEPPTADDAAQTLGKRPAENGPEETEKFSKAAKLPEAPPKQDHSTASSSSHSSETGDKKSSAQQAPAARPASTAPTTKVRIFSFLWLSRRGSAPSFPLLRLAWMLYFVSLHACGIVHKLRISVGDTNSPACAPSRLSCDDV